MPKDPYLSSPNLAVANYQFKKKKESDLSNIMDEYRRREVNIQRLPPVIYLESVAGCPFSCAMCKPLATKPQRVSSSLLKKLEPAYANLEVLAIHGQGEPLLADLEYFVRQSLANNFVLHMDTNGLLLTDEIADILLKTRLSIRFSIHAGRPETYYRIMGVDLNKVKQNIRRLVTRSRNAPGNHDFWFSFIVMKENIQEVEEFLLLSNECGIHNVRFMHLWPNHDTLKGVTIRGLNFKYSEQSGNRIKDEFKANLPRYKMTANELGITIEWGDAGKYDHSPIRYWNELANKVSSRVGNRWIFPLVPQKGFCAAPWLGQLTVKFNGDLLLCCTSSIILGNLYHSSLEAIWYGPQMTRIRQSFQKGYFPHECGYCRGFGLNNYPNNSFVNYKR